MEDALRALHRGLHETHAKRVQDLESIEVLEERDNGRQREHYDVG